VEKRGYNLTIEKLAKNLLGGSVNVEELKEEIKGFEDMDFDGVFVATSGNLKTEKCKKRLLSNPKLQPMYLRIAQEYVSELLKICPFIKCVMTSGSMASGGLGEGDDIDLNIVVKDGFKYTSYLLAVLLSFKYSFKYGKKFWRRYVICINVIWEEHQVKPFERKDMQIALELLNAKVLYNQKFFDEMLTHNTWFTLWFPQIKERKHGDKTPDPPSETSKRLLPLITETISRKILFFFAKIMILSLFRDHNVMERMQVKHPYSIFDIP
jgi:predicted nucleotidyltransferase